MFPSLCKRQQAFDQYIFQPRIPPHFSLVNVVAVTFNMAVAEKIVANASSQ